MSFDTRDKMTNLNKESEFTENDVSYSVNISEVGSRPDLNVSDRDAERGHWGSKAEFVLSCIGYSVGLGNVWRFPFLAYKNGGAAFLIPYIILQFVVGKPMYFMELMIGQFSGLGTTAVWKCSPISKGVGFSMVVVSLIVAIYYNVIMAYTLYYLFASMQSTLPWTVCTPEGILAGCVENQGKAIALMSRNCSADVFGNSTSYLTHVNATISDPCAANTNFTRPIPASEEYFFKSVIQLSAGLEPGVIGLPLWKLTLCLLLSWIVVCLCLIRGVKSSGKVVYFTATFPYLVLIILLVRGASLDGAKEGALFFIVPKWEKLLNIEVWKDAASQMFFSLGISFGGTIMFGSYNKFKNNVYMDALIISAMDLLTSVIAGFVIFTVLGAMAKEMNMDIENVVAGGFGLAFVTYPEALSRLPLPQLWSILFFFMLFTLGLDSEFALLETILTALQDEVPRLRRYKPLLCVGTAAVCFVLALPCVTPGGLWVIELMDSHGATFVVLFIAFSELVGIFWIYGIRRFNSDVKYMLGFTPHVKYYWNLCWVILAPFIVAALFVYSLVKFKPMAYSEDHPYPVWAHCVGWIISAMVMVPIPMVAVYTVLCQKGSLWKRLRKAASPASDWGPADSSISATNVFYPNNTSKKEYFTVSTQSHNASVSPVRFQITNKL